MGSKEIKLDFKDTCYNLIKDKPLKTVKTVINKDDSNNYFATKISIDEQLEILKPGQIIYGPNDMVLCKVEANIEDGEQTSYLYKDNFGFDILIPLAVNNWKSKDLRNLYEKAIKDNKSSEYLKQLKLINLLISNRGKSILANKKLIINKKKEYTFQLFLGRISKVNEKAFFLLSAENGKWKMKNKKQFFE